MSFDIYLQCEPPGISEAEVRSLFPIVEESSEPDCWSVRYGERNSCTISITPDKSDNQRVTFLSVNRPCGDIRFWESVLKILRMGCVTLYWPGGGPLVASASAATSIPQEMVESLGRPAVVSSAQEIIDAIRKS